MVGQHLPGRVGPAAAGLAVATVVALFLSLSGAVYGYLAAAGPTQRPRGVPGAQVSFRKVVLDREFRSEGITVADVNHDGRLDILAGDMWYEAPNWTPREIRPTQKYDGEHGYSDSFICYPLDVNADGWMDEVVIGMPAGPAVWRENPEGKPGPWQERQLWRSACNESPGFGDILGNKRPVLVFPYDGKTMAWYELAKDKNYGVVVRDIGEGPGCQQFSHGLGVGDVNGDGRADVLCTDGWYQAPADPRKGPWPFVRADLGPACAQMVVYDVNHDGLPDVISSSAHERGVWWHEQRRGPNGPEFVRHTIDDTISETHALILADINGDGQPDIVTGKRFWAHGPTGDVGAGEPAVLVWYEMKRAGGQASWVKHQIDDDSGVGTQFVVADVNRDGLPDVVVSNKKGVFLFLQERRRK